MAMLRKPAAAKYVFWFGVLLVSAVTMICGNKAAILAFPYPNLLMLMQNGFATLALGCGLGLGRCGDAKPFTQRQFRVFAVTAGCTATQIVSSFMALPLVAIATTVAFRNLCTVVIAVIEWLAFDARMSAVTVGGLSLVVVGMGIYAGSDHSFDATGYLWLALNSGATVTSALWSRVFVQKMAASGAQTPTGVSLIVQSETLPIAFALAALRGEFLRGPSALVGLGGGTVALLALTCVGGLGIGVAHAQCYALASGTAVTVASTANKAVAIILAHHVFHTSMNGVQVLGLVVCIGGALLYAVEQKHLKSHEVSILDPLLRQWWEHTAVAGGRAGRRRRRKTETGGEGDPEQVPLFEEAPQTSPASLQPLILPLLALVGIVLAIGGFVGGLVRLRHQDARATMASGQHLLPPAAVPLLPDAPAPGLQVPPAAGQGIGCGKQCSLPLRSIVMWGAEGGHPYGSGLDDRHHVITDMASIAAHLCAKLVARQPCIVLGRHNLRNETLSCDQPWTDYLNITYADDARTPVPFPVEDPQAIADAATIWTPYEHRRGHGTLAEYATALRQAREGRPFVWLVDRWFYSWIKPFKKANTDLCSSALVESPTTFVTDTVRRVWASPAMRAVDRRNHTVLHVRRGDMLEHGRVHSCNTSTAAIEALLRCRRSSMSLGEAVLLMTDEMNQAYLDRLSRAIQRLGVTFVNLNTAVLSVVLPDENNYRIYQVEQALRSAARFNIDLHTDKKCDNQDSCRGAVATAT